jgi:hypothetical protein
MGHLHGSWGAVRRIQLLSVLQEPLQGLSLVQPGVVQGLGGAAEAALERGVPVAGVGIVQVGGRVGGGGRMGAGGWGRAGGGGGGGGGDGVQGAG